MRGVSFVVSIAVVVAVVLLCTVSVCERAYVTVCEVVRV